MVLFLCKLNYKLATYVKSRIKFSCLIGFQVHGIFSKHWHLSFIHFSTKGYSPRLSGKVGVEFLFFCMRTMVYERQLTLRRVTSNRTDLDIFREAFIPLHPHCSLNLFSPAPQDPSRIYAHNFKPLARRESILTSKLNNKCKLADISTCYCCS